MHEKQQTGNHKQDFSFCEWNPIETHSLMRSLFKVKVSINLVI